MSNSESLLGFLLVMFVIAFYFLPWIVASIRSHNSTLAIFILNLILGWSLLGWVIALVWACTCNVKSNNVTLMREG